MTIDDVQNLATILGLLSAVGGGLLAAYRYLDIKSRTEKMTLIGEAFRLVVAGLASDREVDRLAAAVLLRRFFDPLTEYGVKDLPYSNESINVIAAMLRTLPTGVLQKLLADGLAYAPSLEGVDLQAANLEEAYFGGRNRKPVNLSRADLYKAKLVRASLKGVCAIETVFFEADLSGTVFIGANLCRADFRSAILKDTKFGLANLEEAKFDNADLANVRFEGAKLRKASFKSALNVPEEIQRKLDAEGCYSE